MVQGLILQSGTVFLKPKCAIDPLRGVGRRDFLKMQIPGVSLVARLVKNLPALQETWVRSLGREDTLEKRMATHSSTLAWRIPWTEESGRLQSLGLRRVGHDCVTSYSLVT